MAFGTRQVSVTNGGKVAVLSAKGFAGARAKLVNGSVDIFIGGDDLTAANTATKGSKIAASASQDIVIDKNETVYAVCATGTGPSTLTIVGTI